MEAMDETSAHVQNETHEPQLPWSSTCGT
jgi:hypothetical protein